jgi:integrase
MHDFRHTFATMLWKAGVVLKTAIKWMGHADQTVIIKIYAHLIDRKKEEAAVKMGRGCMKSLFSPTRWFSNH